MEPFYMVRTTIDARASSCPLPAAPLPLLCYSSPFPKNNAQPSRDTAEQGPPALLSGQADAQGWSGQGSDRC